MKRLMLVLLFTCNALLANELTKIWEIQGFLMPKSIVASSDYIYVSNVNADKKGFISRLTKEGKVDTLHWITGLDNPAGLALLGNSLYVGDGSRVHVIDITQGKIVKSVSSSEAKGLNDVTIAQDGQIFISDIQTGKIFTLHNNTLSLWFASPKIKHPNGLHVKDGHLFIAEYASKLSHELSPQEFGSIYKVSLTNKSYETVPIPAKVEVVKNHTVLVLRINDLPRNTVSKHVLHTINEMLDKAEKDTSIGAVVITGSKNVFSLGAGGESLQKTKNGEASQAVIAHRLFKRIEGFPKPIIAAINGMSAGGGNELALACDIRIAGESATFRQHELQAGLIPGFGGMQRLSRHIGQSRAMEMMLTGRLIKANEAFMMGLVSSVVTDEKVVDEAIALGEQLSKIVDKKALAVFKKRMAVSYDERFSTALENDQKAFDVLATSPDVKVAIGQFIERQKQLKK